MVWCIGEYGTINSMKASSSNTTKATSVRTARVQKKSSKAAVSDQKKQPLAQKNVKKAKKPITAAKLYAWNKWLAVIHLIQGVAILVLSNSVTFPVTTSFLTVDPLNSSEGMPTLVPATQHVLDINLAYLVAAFFFISALAHATIATVYRKRYEAELEEGINRARWVEYSISASIMMVAIGVLVGVYDLSTLIMLFALTAVMNLLGLVMELHNKKSAKPSWSSYIVGSIAGIVPWIVIALYLGYGALYGSTAPTFVYVIFVSIFVFFMSFAVNMYLQYKRTGKWSDYLYGERGYMILSLVAKSALAWQVFGGTLRP